MPFEPKYFDPEDRESPQPLGDPPEPEWDDDAELALPDDLAALAQQLQEDAVYLAKRHPADATPEQREAAMREEQPQRESLPWYRAAAAAAILVAAMSGWVTWKNMQPNNVHQPAVAKNPARNTVSDAVAAVPMSSSIAAAGTTLENDNHVGTTSLDELPASGARLTPAAFLREVSAPELDAMLDLFEQQDDSGLSL